MIRRKFRLTEEQFETVKRLAEEQNVSRAEIIRRAVDRFVCTQHIPDREESD